MIRTELYFDFRELMGEDYTEQMKFYEQHAEILENEEYFKNLKSRKEFLRRIFILHYCGGAYFKSKKFEIAIGIFDSVINKIVSNKDKYNIDLNKEYYFIESLAEKGIAQYQLKNFSGSEETFKIIMDTGFATLNQAQWYTDCRNVRMFRSINLIFLIAFFAVLVLPNFLTFLSPSSLMKINIFGLFLIVVYFINPSKRLSAIFAKMTMNKFENQNEGKVDPITYYSEKVNANPNDYTALIERGKLYYDQDKFERALEDLSIALEINNGNYDALYYRACTLSNLDRHAEAIVDLSLILSIDKYESADIAEIYNLRASSYLALNKKEQALNDYNKAIELEPYFAQYIFDRAYFHQVIGRNKEAIVDYNLVIKIEPEDYIALTNRGEAYYALGDKKKALQDFKSAVKYDYQEAINNLNKLVFE